jgi:hypothetical protein
MRAEPPLGAAVGYGVILLCPRIIGTFCRVGGSARVVEIPDRFLPLAGHVVGESAIRGLGRCQLRALWASMPADRSPCCGPGRSLVADVSAFLGEVAACAALGWVWWLAARAGIVARAFPASRATVLPAGRCCSGLGAAGLVTSVRRC